MKTRLAVLAMTVVFPSAPAPLGDAPVSYQLGPGDRVAVSAGDLKELDFKPATVELDGSIEFQYTGRLQATGLTCAALAAEIEAKLRPIVREPKVKVEVAEYGSQPVSILGSVNKPGVHQLRGPRSLVDVLALAEGLKLEAGNAIKITRRRSAGPLPLSGARPDSTGEFTTGEVGVKALLEARLPELNIRIRPHDVISVPRADLIYVLGNVRKPGGFPLAERESMTILQALSLAEGVDTTGAPQRARVIRSPMAGAPPSEVPIDVKKILAGKLPDRALQPNDILFVPSSRAKSVGLRALEAGIQVGTGIAIWRR